MLTPYYRFPSLVVSHHFYITRTLTTVIFHSKNGNSSPPFATPWKVSPCGNILGPMIFVGHPFARRTNVTDVLELHFFFHKSMTFLAYNKAHDPSSIISILTPSIPICVIGCSPSLFFLTTSFCLITSFFFHRRHTPCTYNAVCHQASCLDLVLHHGYSC